MLDRFKFLTTSSFDEHRARAKEIIPEIVRLDPERAGPFRCDVTGFTFDTTADCTGIFSVQQTSAMSLVADPSTGVRLVIPTTSSFEIVHGRTVRSLAAAGIAGLLPVDELALRLTAGHHICASANRSRVDAAVRLFECDAEADTILGRFFLEPGLPGLQLLADHVRRAIATLDDSPKAVIDLPAFRAAYDQILVLRLAEVLATAAASDTRRAVGRNTAALQRAEEYIRAHAERHVDLAAMARHAGLSLRSLQILFRANHDCTIVQYVRRHRLALARARLEHGDPETTIAEIARLSGFSHLGHFTAAYKTAFGEPPGQTLRRARRVSP
ncbi:AraC family transcriptional regulator [Rhodoplanes sp. TEM]|uniref:AraC family transcriptional regulator n=1 Tax=Rhodoplanes tepidamans TaxID=200616 RepID=A0ABT5J972_RHOTP|nr:MULTISPECIES: AraC family transcriptional regulator [Rhodoplanes]MDC7786195.1 AraC family transcriptional regulator [Rhodoplanes tepidamans]MDC7982862.1 AraC family transcriptional regulator [Rhodoplanes sp. TEM]MDQ0357139.1 AraC-like DNA-binding protein [Rhodoplanes tepidamans]